MISIHLEAADLENIRFAYSPLLEAVMSFRTLKLAHYTPLEPWADDARRSLNGLEFPYLDGLILARHWIVDFLTPTPTCVERSFEDELARLRSTPVEVVRKNAEQLIRLYGPSAIRDQFLAYPRESMDYVIDELRLYWQHAVARHWPRVISVLESDMLYHARLLALKGADEMMNELHPRLHYQPGILMLEKNSTPYETSEHRLGGTGIQLVPAVFSTSALSFQMAPEWLPMVIYGARGAGLWYEPSLPDPEEALVSTVGQGKAKLLLALKTPAHTSELAHTLDVTAGAVSQQLGKLSQAGLVESRRSSNRVYYQLTPRGEKLLLLFAG